MPLCNGADIGCVSYIDNIAGRESAIGSAILNIDLLRAQKILQGLGVSNPSDSDLNTQAYYIYNHGSNKPPRVKYVEGLVETNDYLNHLHGIHGAQGGPKKAPRV